MGLLDNFFGNGFEDPKTAAVLQLAAGLQSGRTLGQGLTQGAIGYNSTLANARAQAQAQQALKTQQALQQQLMQAQIGDTNAQAQQRQAQVQQMAAAQAAQQRAAQQEEEFRGLIRSPQFMGGQAALQGGGGPTMANAQRQQPVDPMMQLQYDALRLGQMKPMDYLAAQRKDTSPIKLEAGSTLYDPTTRSALFTAPTKPGEAPSAVREYEYARGQGYQGSFTQFENERRKAGATSIGLKVENKMGDSLAGQVGPLARDSRIATDGAVKMFDAASRIETALNSDKVMAGPMASKIQTVRQFAQVVGGGNDEGIRQTRQVIKSLAQMSVEARKQLAGQGQVTESEAAAVAKADAGDINDLTTGELRDLVTLTKRAAHFQAQSHNRLLETMSASDVTRPVVPFYQVRGADTLLKHVPQLPQIGGAPNIDSLVEKYRTPK